MNNETIELLANRRSIRAFENRPIEEETIKKLKELTLRAPTGGNMTTYSVIEVTDPEVKSKLAKICDNQPMIERAPGVWVFLADFERWYNWIKDGGSPERCGKELRHPGLGYLHLAMQDAIVAAETAVIAADALGLGSCYVGDIIENYEELQALMELPPLAAPAAMIIFGYPKACREELTLRPDEKYVFFPNKYHMQDTAECEKMYERHTARYKEKKIIPHGKVETYADHYFNRKVSSDFMKEMDRSAAVFMKRWCEEESSK